MFSANDTTDLLSTMGLEKGMDWSLTIIFTVVGAGLVYARAVHAAVPPGPLRMLLFAPCIVVNAVLPATLMDPFKTFILTGLISANFAWWTNFKLIAFALDRGQLMRAQNAPLLVWLMVAGSPMRIDNQNPVTAPAPAAAGETASSGDGKNKKPVSSVGPRVKDPSLRAWWIRFLGKVLLVCVTMAIDPLLPPGPNELRHLSFAFGIIYAVLGIILDATAAFSAGQGRCCYDHCSCSPRRRHAFGTLVS